MIHDVDETIREIVRREVVNGGDVDISFDTPSKDWAAKQSGPTLNFYLYDIREDLNRRLVEFVELRDTDGRVVERRQPPRRYKLSYLATAWTQRPEDEHRLLSAVLGAFIQSDILPPDVLQGALTDEVDPVKVTIALPPPQDRSISDVWNALGGELKPSLDLVVTAPFSPERFEHVGPPVSEPPRIRISDGDREETRAGRAPAGEEEGGEAAKTPSGEESSADEEQRSRRRRSA